MQGIIIDEKLCTKCNICSTVCSMKVIQKESETSYPTTPENRLKSCLKCGHCEAFCPQKALTLDFMTEDKFKENGQDEKIEPEKLSLYIKKRRSIRNYSSKPVPKDVILQVIDTARYAASGGNSQQVKWLVTYDADKVKQISKLTKEWMETLRNTSHPLANFVDNIINMYDNGVDLIINNAPHLIFTCLPSFHATADPTDAVIAMTHFDIAAPSFGLGSCWAGFIKMAANGYKPLQDVLSIPEDHKVACAMMFGYPTYKPVSVPRRNPVQITWG